MICGKRSFNTLTAGILPNCVSFFSTLLTNPCPERVNVIAIAFCLNDCCWFMLRTAHVKMALLRFGLHAFNSFQEDFYLLNYPGYNN